MEDSECPPVTVEGDWSPEQNKTVKNKLQLYFQSKKKSSGGDCRVEVEEEAPTASVFFRSQDVRERVLAKKHHEISVGNKALTLRLSLAPGGEASQSPPSSSDVASEPAADSKNQKLEPEKGSSATNQKDLESGPRSTAVLLENVQENLSQDLLQMMVETISGLDENDFSLEIIWETNMAILIFNSPEDAEKFVSVSQTNSKMKKLGLTARPLEATKSIRMESLPQTVVKDMIELWFEKHWELPEDVVMIPEEQAAIVTFMDPKVVTSICVKEDHVMRSIAVKLYPYYESLGTALYGKERPAWKMPKPVTEKVQRVIWKFLLQKKMPKSINNQMDPHFCSVDLDHPEVKLSPLPSFLKQKGLTAKDVDNWAEVARAAFCRLMSEYTAFESDVNTEAWKAAEKEVRSVVREDALVDFDPSRDVVTIAGRADDIKKIRAPVENIILKLMNHVQRQTKSITELLEFSPAYFAILKEEGLQKAAADISSELKVSFNEGTGKLSLTGLPEEVYKTKSWILERNMSMRKKQLNLPPSLLDYLRSVDSTDMSMNLFTSQGISAVYCIDFKGVSLVGSSDRALADAESKMKKDLLVQTLDVPDQGVLSQQKWMDLNRDLLDTYNFSNKKTVIIWIHPERIDKVTVAGFSNPVKEVSVTLRQFIEDYSQSPPSSSDVASDRAADSKDQKSEPEKGASATNQTDLESGPRSTAVLLENVQENLSQDLLQMIVETISGLDENDFSLEIIWETNMAVLIFNSPEDVEKFVSVSQTNSKMKKLGLTARPLEAAKSIRMESLPPTVVKDMIELWFEKHWELPEDVVMIPEEQAAIVTFMDPKVVTSVCVKEDHVMRSIAVKLYPYYESLGTALYGKERPAWKMPEPVTEKVQRRGFGPPRGEAQPTAQFPKAEGSDC
ncbi:protein mono-ADP-ribosyltransferase PARP14 [Fundulus heteroclitus]|uniref:protein mono-ADP-ribosyltransferase PARP14 n=1 Tax=Fundulus heteroclitus TaxID=8078 RepID=UPI00165CD377|nr:protein mono-ADP-ribosyltransferase PARP14 [Fundulus heteroclitus]